MRGMVVIFQFGFDVADEKHGPHDFTKFLFTVENLYLLLLSQRDLSVYYSCDPRVFQCVLTVVPLGRRIAAHLRKEINGQPKKYC